MVTQISKRLSFLKYLKRHFKPSLIYYPACGADKLPKQVFGTYHVVHLSLPEDESRCGYLESLGEGIKLLGDMGQSNLADSSIDLIYLHIGGIQLTNEMIKDFDRVLKPKGIISIEGGGYTFANRQKWNKYFQWFKNYQVLNLPTEFKSGQVVYGVRLDEQDSKIGGFNGRYVASEQAMKALVGDRKGYHGFEEILDYAIFQKV